MSNSIKFWFTLKRLFSYGQQYRYTLIIAIIMLWLASAIEVTSPIILSYFIDDILPNKKFIAWTLAKIILGFCGLQVISVLLRYYQALLFHRTAFTIVQQLRTEVMNSTLRQPLSFFDNQSVGQLISKVTNDTEIVKDLYVTVVATVLRSIALISTMLVAMFLLNWPLACISLLLFPIIMAVMWLYQFYNTPLIRKLRTCIADINHGFNEAINGMRVIQHFRQQQRFGSKLQLANYAHFHTRMATLRLEGYLLRPLLSLLFALLLCGMLLLFGLRWGKTISVGILYAFINYLGRLNEPLIELTAQQSILQQAVVAGERIFALIDGPSPQHYGQDMRPLNGGAIMLRDLSFAYHCDLPPVLHHINLTAPARSFLALVGHTGSGKSTLANLLMGYYPVDHNTLLLDGRSIDTLSYQVLRQGVVMVQQDPIIIAETIYENITLGRKISEHQVWHILEQVQLVEFVRAQPNGLFTVLGEYGNTLSVGQKQLLAIARVLVSLATPAILILDEATANIDSYTEQAIAHALKTVLLHTTLVVIAHRLSTIIEADQILVLHRGKVLERGTHNELLQLRGCYYQMYQLQTTKQITVTIP